MSQRLAVCRRIKVLTASINTVPPSVAKFCPDLFAAIVWNSITAASPLRKE